MFYRTFCINQCFFVLFLVFQIWSILYFFLCNALKNWRVATPHMGVVPMDTHCHNPHEDPSLNWLTSELGSQKSLSDFSQVSSSLSTTVKYKIDPTHKLRIAQKKPMNTRTPIRTFRILWDKHYFWPFWSVKHLEIVNTVITKIDYTSKTI